jgi:hypothetical protein
MDQGEELWCSNELRDVAFAARYDFEPTGFDAASENGKVKWANGTFGAMVRCLLYSAGLHTHFWSAALVHAVYLKNLHYHKTLCITPHEAWKGEKPSLAHLRTFCALVTARKPGRRPAKADRHIAHGVLLGYGSTPTHIRYFDQTMNREKLSTHHMIDEAHYGTTKRPPGPHILMDMGYDQEPVLLALTNVPPNLRYPFRSRHGYVTPFVCKLLSLPMNYFTSAPVAVIASVSSSDIACNSSVTVTFSTDPFWQSFPETILVSGIHPTIGLVLHYDVDRHRCQLIKMDLGTPSHRLPQWKSRLRSAYIVSIDTMSVHTISIVVVFTKKDAPNCLSAVGLHQPYFDQLQLMRGHIDNTVLAVVHKAITGPKFNHRTLQKQLDWNDWLAIEWIQLDNYDKQEMFGAPRTVPVHASVFYWVWLYSIRGVCDGSTRGGKTMIHGATYAPTPQQIYFRLHISLAATLGMYLWHADVTNAFAEAERPEQMYYMHCDRVFRNWWAEQYPTIPLRPDAVVPVLKNKVILKAHASGQFDPMVLLLLSTSRTQHMPRACITALSMQNLLSSFEWSMISLLHVSLRRHTPSCATYWTKIGKYTCHDMA